MDSSAVLTASVFGGYHAVADDLDKVDQVLAAYHHTTWGHSLEVVAVVVVVVEVVVADIAVVAVVVVVAADTAAAAAVVVVVVVAFQMADYVALVPVALLFGWVYSLEIEAKAVVDQVDSATSLLLYEHPVAVQNVQIRIPPVEGFDDDSLFDFAGDLAPVVHQEEQKSAYLILVYLSWLSNDRR